LDLLRGPAAGGMHWRWLLVRGINGAAMATLDNAANLTAETRQSG
jgi:hypothetical protein